MIEQLDEKGQKILVTRSSYLEMIGEKVKKHWNSVEELRLDARALRIDGFYDEAVRVYTRMLELKPDDDEAAVTLAALLIAMQKDVEAETLLVDWIGRNEHADSIDYAYVNLAKVRMLGKLGPEKFKLGLLDLQKCLTLNPENENGWGLLKLRELSKQQNEAIDAFVDQWRRREPASWLSLLANAMRMETYGNESEADKLLNLAVEVSRGNDFVLGFYTGKLGPAGKVKKIIALLENARWRKNLGWRSLNNLAMAYCQLSRFRDALKALEEARSKVPDYARDSLEQFIANVKQALNV